MKKSRRGIEMRSGDKRLTVQENSSCISVSHEGHTFVRWSDLAFGKEQLSELSRNGWVISYQ
jgi:Mu DNA-binding domain